MLDYQYFKDHYQLTAVDRSKQKELHVDPRAIQQTEFYGKLDTILQVCTVLEKPKETVLEFCKGTAKVLLEINKRMKQNETKEQKGDFLSMLLGTLR